MNRTLWQYLIYTMVMDLFTVMGSRSNLHQVLYSQMSRNKAEKIYEQQSLKQKIKMSFILNHLIRHKKEAVLIYRLYRIAFYIIPIKCLILFCSFSLDIDQRETVFFVIMIFSTCYALSVDFFRVKREYKAHKDGKRPKKYKAKK